MIKILLQKVERLHVLQLKIKKLDYNDYDVDGSDDRSNFAVLSARPGRVERQGLSGVL